MPRSSSKRRAYKELTLRQLRSFSETARLGSLAAAAKTLGLTHPTVREQVLALQRKFQVPLIEPHARGCRLTADGRLLAEIVAPLVTSAAAVERRFQLAREQAEVRLVIASTPRIFQEDLPAAVQSLLRDWPQVRMTFLELRDGDVIQAVESGNADFGLTTTRIPTPPPPGLSFEPGYELETLLITSRHHPLANRRSVRPSDLSRYPMISSHHTFSDEPDIAAMFDRRRVFDGPTPHVEPFQAATVRAYVQLNLGIALVYGRLQRRRKAALHERSMSSYFGRVLVRFVFRQGAATEELARALAGMIRQCNPSGTRS